MDSRSVTPVVGARIGIEGTQLTAVTDAAGRFQFAEVSGTEAILVVTRVGYRPLRQTVAVGDQAVQLQLTESAISLDEVIVTGTPAGVTERRALGNAVSRLSVADLAIVSPARDLDDFMKSRATSVVLQSSGGDVGSGSQIRIRGLSSLSVRNSPILYVDGVRVDFHAGPRPGTAVALGGYGPTGRLNDIDPSQIESIEIIKGPAAATLYGTEASNGVIQIITKQGQSGATRVSVMMEQGASWIPDPEGTFPTTYSRAPDGTLVSYNFVASESARGTPVFRTGHNQRYVAEISGGSDFLRYFGSGSIGTEEGVLRPNNVRRFAGRFNVTAALSEKLTLSSGVGYTNTVLHPGANALGGSPTSCTFFANPLTKDSETRGCSSPPGAWAEVWDRNQLADRTTLNVSADFRLFEWFTHRLTLGADLVNETNEAVVEQFSGPFAQYFGGLSQGFNTTSVVSNTNRTFDYSGTATVDLTSSLNSKTSVGVQYFQNKLDVVQAVGQQFPAPGIRSISSATLKNASQSIVHNSTLGFYVQEQLAWNNRVFFTAALRADHNSAFGENFDAAMYPKFSATWVVSEEEFWPLEVISDLRFRAAYGQSGQQPLAFSALQTFQPFIGPGDRSTVRPQFFGNPDLGPERGEEIEIGFDAGLLRDRVGVEFTYYHKTTNDAILNRTMPPSLGFPQQQFVNIGQVRNRGIELNVNATPVSRPGLHWELGLGLATNDNLISDMGGLPLLELFLRQQHREGYPVAGWFERKVVSADVLEDGRTVNVMCDGGPDNANQPVPCTDAPRLFIGQTVPRKSGAFTSSLTLFDRLTLYGMLDFKFDYGLFDGNQAIRCAIFQRCLENFDVETVRRDPLAAAQFQHNIWGDAIFRDADFVKLRQLSATFRLPVEWAQRIGASSATVTVSGRNLHTWTDWVELDPEVGDRYETSAGVFNQQQGNLPQPRQFLTSIRLTL